MYLYMYIYNTPIRYVYLLYVLCTITLYHLTVSAMYLTWANSFIMCSFGRKMPQAKMTWINSFVNKNNVDDVTLWMARNIFGSHFSYYSK